MNACVLKLSVEVQTCKITYEATIPSSVIKNIAHLCSRSRSSTWGADGWKKIVVCVVSDGRSKINQRTLKVLTLVSVISILLGTYSLNSVGVKMGCYQEGIAKDTVNGKDVQAHIFEYVFQPTLSHMSYFLFSC